MESMFKQAADKQNPPTETSAPSPVTVNPNSLGIQTLPPTSGAAQPTGMEGMFTQAAEAAKPVKTQQDQLNDSVGANAGKIDTSAVSGAAKHGLLHRAWDWVNEPMFDNILPEGVKTADLVKAAAFERMFGQAYIPGINDFDTMAEVHMGGPKGEGANKEATKSAIRAFVSGAAKDTSDLAASFTSPLSAALLGADEVIGQVPGAVGKIGKAISPLAGTAFGLQGLWGAGKGAQKMVNEGVTPENTQETLSGLGQAFLGAHGAAKGIAAGGEALLDRAKKSVVPDVKTIAGQEVPVRAKGILADAAAKSVDESVNQRAADNTARAVQQGVGEVTKNAVGSRAETEISDRDRLGVRAHADDLRAQSVPAFKELDRLSDNAYSDAQEIVKNSAKDFSTEGRENYKSGKALQDAIMDRHREDLAAAGYDVDEMKANYRKSVALDKIAKSFDTATSAREGGGYDVDGKKLATQIDRLRRQPDGTNLFERAGLKEDHINALGDLADTLRSEQVLPKFGGLTKLAAKALTLATFGHGAGISGIAEALTGESLAEKLGSKVMSSVLGEAMTSEPVARELNAKMKQGPAALSNWDKFKETAARLWKEDRGEAGVSTPEEEQTAEHEANGGSTFSAKGENLSGTDQYSVGAHPERTQQVDSLGPDEIRKFKTLNADLLNQEGHGIGTWSDPETGKHVLDVVKTFGDRDEAVNAGKLANQKAIYHLGGEGEIPTGGTGEGSLTDAMKAKYGTTNDVHKAGFILPEGDMIPLVGEHDAMLGGKPTDNLREGFIRDSGAIRTRYRMSRAGEEQVFSLPKEITPEQARQIGYAASSLKNGRIVLETVDGQNHESIDFPTAAKAKAALDKLVTTKEATETPSFNLVSAPDGSSHTLEIQKGGDTIGHLAIEQGTPDSWTIKDAVVQRGETGKGYGKAAYSQAFKEARDAGMKTVESDISMTSKAASVWKSLAKENPGAISEENGQYTVDLGKLGPKAPVSGGEASEITTRRPKSVSGDRANNPGQMANMDAVNQAGEDSPSRQTAAGKPVMGYKEKLARTVANYTGVNYSEAELAHPDKVIGKFVDHVADNLTWLYDQVPEEIRAKTRQWYDSAHETMTGFAKDYSVTPEQAAGVTAALSPQNPWDNNVALAKRMMDTYKNRQNFDFTPQMERKIADLKAVPTQSKAFKGLMKDIAGKRLSEVTNSDPDVQAVQRALWIRLYDEAHNSPVNDAYAPTGEVTGHSPDARSWIGLDHMGKAVKILDNGAVDNINDVMGQGHKIRNFYNNLINPQSQNGHVTIDTHAVSASHLSPFGPKDTVAAHNFGGTTPGIPGAPKDAATGLQGTYPLYAEAYQRVAKKLGIMPRELQSVTWEAIKSLMGDEKKTPELKARVKEIWQQVQDGELTPNAARDMIKNEAQGFSKPAWMSDAEWEKHGPGGDASFNPGEIENPNRPASEAGPQETYERVKTDRQKRLPEAPATVMWMTRGGKQYMADQDAVWSHDEWARHLKIPNDRYTERGYAYVDPETRTVELKGYGDKFTPQSIVHELKASYRGLKDYKFVDGENYGNGE